MCGDYQKDLYKQLMEVMARVDAMAWSPSCNRFVLNALTL